jgi:hypothetical protein
MEDKQPEKNKETCIAQTKKNQRCKKKPYKDGFCKKHCPDQEDERRMIGEKRPREEPRKSIETTNSKKQKQEDNFEDLQLDPEVLERILSTDSKKEKLETEKEEIKRTKEEIEGSIVLMILVALEKTGIKTDMTAQMAQDPLLGKGIREVMMKMINSVVNGEEKPRKRKKKETEKEEMDRLYKLLLTVTLLSDNSDFLWKLKSYIVPEDTSILPSPEDLDTVHHSLFDNTE